MIRTINDITVQEVNDAAQRNAEAYDRMFKKAARVAFIEGVMWAQKVHRDKRLPLELENTEFDYGHNINHHREGEA